MIQVTPQMRVLVAVDPVDFRKGIDGLAAVCRKRLAGDPFSGVVFVFGNRRRTSIKILVYDGQGFWVCQKRLSQGRFRWWPDALNKGASRELPARELGLLLWNGDPVGARMSPPWRPLCAERA